MVYSASLCVYIYYNHSASYISSHSDLTLKRSTTYNINAFITISLNIPGIDLLRVYETHDAKQSIYLYPHPKINF